MNNPFTEAIRGLGRNVSGLLTGENPLAQPSITSLFGFTVPGTPLISVRDYFLSQMESWFTTIPMRTQWMVLIEGYPELLQTSVLHNLERIEGNFNNFNISQAVSILKSYPLNKVAGCIFAQGADISNGRSPFTDLTLQFRETNTSFVDFVVRPWTILAEHFGMIARPPGDKRNVGATIKILQFTRTYQNISQIPRKIWTFYNCMPTSVGNTNLTYDQEMMDIANTTWAFSNYTIENNLYLPLPDIINKINKGGFKSLIPRISPFQN